MRKCPTVVLALLLIAFTAAGVHGQDLPKPTPEKVGPDKPDPREVLLEQLKKMVPELIQALKDSDSQVRAHAAQALVTMDRLALPALVETLDGKDNKLRVEAAKLIALMGTYGRRPLVALLALTKALKDDDTEVRRAAAYAISQIVVGAE